MIYDDRNFLYVDNMREICDNKEFCFGIDNTTLYKFIFIFISSIMVDDGVVKVIDNNW